MNIRSLTTGLQYRGEAEGKRQMYHIFEGKRQYLVMSFSRSKSNAGNFNVVDVDAVDYVVRRFGGQQDISAKAIYRASRKPHLLGSSLAALNILYVLVATGRAKVDKRFNTPGLHFNVKSEVAAA